VQSEGVGILDCPGMRAYVSNKGINPLANPDQKESAWTGKILCGELLAWHRVRGDDGNLPRTCGLGDVANPGTLKWRRDHLRDL
jgi:hypothetical protein